MSDAVTITSPSHIIWSDCACDKFDEIWFAEVMCVLSSLITVATSCIISQRWKWLQPLNCKRIAVVTKSNLSAWQQRRQSCLVQRVHTCTSVVLRPLTVSWIIAINYCVIHALLQCSGRLPWYSDISRGRTDSVSQTLILYWVFITVCLADCLLTDT